MSYLDYMRECYHLFEKMIKEVPFEQPWSDDSSLEDLVKIGETTLPFYRRVLKKLVSGSKGVKVLVDLKTPESIESKIRRGKKLSQITDLVRGAILGGSDDFIRKLVMELSRDDRSVEIEYKDYGEDAKYGYYGSYHILYKVYNKDLEIDVICEIQLMTRRLWAYKEPAHQIYGKTREMPQVPKTYIDQSKSLFKKGNLPIDREKLGNIKKQRAMSKFDSDNMRMRYDSVDRSLLNALYEDYSDMVLRAEELAIKAHLGQKRRDSGDDYIVHPGRVVSRLVSHGLTSDEMLAAAWLHDTFEDGSLEIRQEIENQMPEKVIEIIDYLSQRDGETKMEYLRRCFEGPIESQLIKVADRIDNLLDGRSNTEWLKKYYKTSKFIRDSVEGINSSLVEEYLKLFEEIYK